MPYVPESSADLPDHEFLVFSDHTHKVRIVDASELKRQGEFSFPGVYETPTLNRGDPSAEYTLRKLMVFYEAAEDTTMTIESTGDGGENWDDGVEVELEETVGTSRKRAVAGFNTTGFDLRVRLILDRDEVVTIYGYRATVIRRSDIHLSGGMQGSIF